MPTATASRGILPRNEGGRLPARRPDWDSLKILIASTPKTGNTWLKYLLSEIYELPVADLSPNYRDGVPGARWVGHQHYLPESGLIEWGRRMGVVFVTMVRHPGDVLVSLRHYSSLGEVTPQASHDPASMLRDTAEPFGDHTARYVDQGFFLMLHASICWSQGGWSRVVRYENLRRNPVETLRRLTGAILPVADDRIEAAVHACDLKRMRRRFPADRKFYRKGGVGDWQSVLPPAIQRRFMADPYPAQFAALGYDGVAGGPRRTSPGRELRRRWRVLRHLPLVIKIWAGLPEARKVRWLDAARGSMTGLGWLNRPAAEDERVPTRFPFITKLALGLHLNDPQMKRAYPDPLGRHRVEFANWFLYFAPGRFRLDRAFVLPMLHAWADTKPRRHAQAI